MNNDVKGYYSGRVNEKARTDFLWQVGKTVAGQEVPQKQIDLIVNAIITRLGLSENDIVIDVGCGNGLLTKRTSEFVREITGIELTQELFEIALEYNLATNIQYVNESVFDIDTEQHKGKYSRIYLYEVLQHFSLNETDNLIRVLAKISKAKAVIYFGGILDIEKKWCFFNTKERKHHYFESILSGEDPLGTWFYKDFFKYLGEKHGLAVECYMQDSDLYTSHYRFDCVMRKK